MKATWSAGKCNIRSGSTICSGVNKGAELDAGDRDKTVDSISLIDGWVNRTNEPRVGAILKVLCGISAEGLARVAGIGRICSE